MNYNPSTMERIGDIKNGLLVETTDMTFDLWGVAQAQLFAVYNRIMVHALFIEVTATALVGAGTLILFNYTSTIPAIIAQPISAASAAIHGMTRGQRISFPGTGVGTPTAITATAGISYGPLAIPFVIGISPLLGVRSVGSIGCLASIAVLTAGTGKASLLYTPVDPGAYAEALL